MENKINIAELLKDCPQGMELYSPMYGIGKLTKITNKIYVKFPKEHNVKCFRLDGKVSEEGEIMLFPKGKTTWDGFVPPCKFKDGDILFVRAAYEWICIYKESENDEDIYKYVAARNHFYHTDITCGNQPLCFKGDISEIRLATEEEKQKLFDAIKENGYKWNAETKTLEKLEYIEDKGNISDGYHTFNELYEFRLLYNAGMFNELAKRGLYDVHKSKRHSDGEECFGGGWFIVQAQLPTGQISNHYEIKDWDLFNIPEKEKANPYDGHTPQDVAKRLRDFLSLKKLIEPKFKVGDRVRHKTTNKDDIYEISKVYDDSYGLVGFTWMLYMKHQDQYELIPNKFNINTLASFKSRVLVRDNKLQKWSPAIWGFYDFDSQDYPYKLIGGVARYCIPYKKNEHLLGKTDDCDEYYKTW